MAKQHWKHIQEIRPGILKTGLKLVKNFGDEELKRKQAAMQDDDDVPKIEGWLSNIRNAVKKYGPGILKTGLKLANNFGEEELEKEVAIAIIQSNDKEKNNEEQQQLQDKDVTNELAKKLKMSILSDVKATNTKQ